MAINLLSLLKDQIGDSVINQAAGLIGENTSATKSAIGTILPALLGSAVSKGSTESGAGKLLSMISEGNFNGSMFNNLSSLLGGGDASNGLMNSGKSLVSSLLGSNQSSVMNIIGKATGLTKNSNSSLMNMLAPMVMGMIGKQVASKGMNAAGLMSMLSSQKQHLSGALPSGMDNLLGFAKTTGKTTQAAATKVAQEAGNSGGGGGFMKWLFLGLIGLLVAGYFGLRTGSDMVDGAAGAVKDTAGNMVDAAGEAGGAVANAAGNAANAAGDAANAAGGAVKSMVGNTMDGAGNLVDEAGNIVAKAGEFTKDASGNIVDAAGNTISKMAEGGANAVEGAGAAAKDMAAGAESNMIQYTVDEAGNLVNPDGEIAFKKGEFTIADNGDYLDGKGNKIGGVLKKIGKAIGSAAGATGDFFKNSFGKMFKKEAGTESVYDLSDITWNPKNNRISNFSKNEVEGLAAALKENPDAKIVVQAFTADGDNKMKNKALSKTRAQVVHDMLVTLGVSDNQISAKGMGAKDDAGNKIQIVVE